MKQDRPIVPMLRLSVAGVVILDFASFMIVGTALSGIQYVAFTVLLTVLGVAIHSQRVPRHRTEPVLEKPVQSAPLPTPKAVPQAVPDPLCGPYHALVQSADGEAHLYVLTGLLGEEKAVSLAHQLHYQAQIHQTLNQIRQSGRRARLIRSALPDTHYQPIFDKQLSQVTADLLQVPSHVINYN